MSPPSPTGRGWGRTIAARWPLLLAIVTAIWIVRYGASFGLHLLSPPRWQGWFDQDHYVRSAIAFAYGDLSADAHWYPPIYALIAAPLVFVTPGDPFFLPNLALYLIACVGFSRAMAPLGLSRGIAVTVFVVATLVADSTASHWQIPWNTTVSAALTWWLIATGVAMVTADRLPATRSQIMLGLIAGALPAVRPTEAITSAAALGAVIVALAVRRRLRPSTVPVVAASAAAALLPLVLLHLAIYGAAPSRYAVEAARQGFAFADLPWKASTLLVTAQPWYPDATAMIERLPWLLPGAAGLMLIGWRGTPAQRRALALIGAVALPYALLFLAYTDLHPPGLWEFGNAHYFAWLFPLAGAGCWLWLRAMGRRGQRAPALLLLLAAALPACVRPLPLAVGDAAPARLLLFRGAAGRPWADAYFAPARIVDAAGTLTNVGQFHQLPDAAGERAIAIVRPFAAHPRRYDPGEAPPFATAEPPYARYAVRWSLGPPCWIARAACALPR